jgi:hypothetical protein
VGMFQPTPWFPQLRSRWIPTAVAASNTFTSNPSGSIVFSGASVMVKGRVAAPTGQLVFSGAAIGLHERASAPSGQFLFSGAVTAFRTRVAGNGGTLNFSGASVGIHGRVAAPSGQIVFSGSAPITGPAGLLRNTINRVGIRLGRVLGLR